MVLFKALFLSLFLISLAYAYDNNDFQVWHSEAQQVKINKNLRAVFEEEFRWADNANDFYYRHYDCGFVWGLNKNLDIGLNYRWVCEKKNGKFKEENRPHLNAFVKWEIFSLKLEDRSRLQYRHFDYQTDFWQYRNKITVKFPCIFSKIEIQPYIADEIFINFYGAAFTRNRFYSGLAMNIIRNLKVEIYYLFQSNRSSGSWKDANALGTKVKLLF